MCSHYFSIIGVLLSDASNYLYNVARMANKKPLVNLQQSDEEIQGSYTNSSVYNTYVMCQLRIYTYYQSKFSDIWILYNVK